MIPPDVLDQVPRVYEILLAVHTFFADDLWDALVARPPRVKAAEVLIQNVFDADYVVKMLDAGFSVYEALLPGDDLIFLDRKQGYRLPGWEPLPDPFSAACNLAWRRMGYYVCVRGAVGMVTDSRLMQIKEREQLWFNVQPDVRLPDVGERVTILAHHPFIDIGMLLLDAVAILPEGATRSSALQENQDVEHIAN